MLELLYLGFFMLTTDRGRLLMNICFFRVGDPGSNPGPGEFFFKLTT
jgi:hypothetical protein